MRERRGRDRAGGIVPWGQAVQREDHDNLRKLAHESAIIHRRLLFQGGTIGIAYVEGAILNVVVDVDGCLSAASRVVEFSRRKVGARIFGFKISGMEPSKFERLA